MNPPLAAGGGTSLRRAGTGGVLGVKSPLRARAAHAENESSVSEGNGVESSAVVRAALRACGSRRRARSLEAPLAVGRARPSEAAHGTRSEPLDPAHAASQRAVLVRRGAGPRDA